MFSENPDKDVGNKGKDQDEDCEEPEGWAGDDVVEHPNHLPVDRGLVNRLTVVTPPHQVQQGGADPQGVEDEVEGEVEADGGEDAGDEGPVEGPAVEGQLEAD